MFFGLYSENNLHEQNLKLVSIIRRRQSANIFVQMGKQFAHFDKNILIYVCFSKFS